MEQEFAHLVLSAAGGGLAGTWGMLRWTNGRIRKLELDRVTPEDCQNHVGHINGVHQEMWRDIKEIAKAVARIEGQLSIRQ